MAAGLSAVGTGLSVAGQIAGGKAQRQAGEYNRQAAYREAEGLEIQAQQEVATATHNSTRIQERSDELLAEQRAAAASGGGSTQDASIVALRDEALATASLDDLLNIASAEERSQQLEYQAEVRRQGGDIQAIQASQRATASFLTAGTTALSGGVSWLDRFG